MTLIPPPAPSLTGVESFLGIDACVMDFWKFAMGDPRTNNVRGYLAEFIVARAVGSREQRVEWDAWDVTAPSGTRIEVKSSGYLQSWAQRKLSVPSFQVSAAYGWDASTGESGATQTFNADVYVFCLQTATSHSAYDPMQLAQWAFYVAGRREIEAQAGVRMDLTTLRRICGDPIAYAALGARIEELAGH